MQDRTINGALLALMKQGGSQGKIAEALLHMRGVEWTGWYQVRPNKRGGTKAFIMGALKDGPKTSIELGKLFHAGRFDLTPSVCANRAYQATLRLEAKGLVLREDKVWRLK